MGRSHGATPITHLVCYLEFIPQPSCRSLGFHGFACCRFDCCPWGEERAASETVLVQPMRGNAALQVANMRYASLVKLFWRCPSGKMPTSCPAPAQQTHPNTGKTKHLKMSLKHLKTLSRISLLFWCIPCGPMLHCRWETCAERPL